MSIKAKTRKILWSRSGNRCLFCKSLLVHKLEKQNANFIVGEECHIISSKEKGPRGNIKRLDDFDSYENLVLLCANHHKLVDDFPETYTYDLLNTLKDNHEKWIEAAIEKDLENYFHSINNSETLDEIKNHIQLDLIIQHCHMYFFDFNSVTDEILSIEIAEMFDNLRDLSDIYSDLEISQKTKYLIDHIKQIEEFNKRGVRFFGKSLIRKYSFRNIPESDYKVAMIIAYNPTVNPKAIENGKLVVTVPEDFGPLM